VKDSMKVLLMYDQSWRLGRMLGLQRWGLKSGFLMRGVWR
jgi:hypothetical protein